MSELTKFQEIEKRLHLALERTKKLLESYKTNPPEGDIWNNTHDLEDRLNSRLWDNYSNFCAWNWDNNGFNVYSL